MTEQTRFTPGPWTALTDYWSDGASVLDANGFQHVEISNTAILHEYEKIAPHWGADERCHYDIPLDVQKANAHLIAAAPDLYAALADIAARLPADEFSDNSPGRIIGDIARAALAKARGQA